MAGVAVIAAVGGSVLATFLLLERMHCRLRKVISRSFSQVSAAEPGAVVTTAIAQKTCGQIGSGRRREDTPKVASSLERWMQSGRRCVSLCAASLAACGASWLIVFDPPKWQGYVPALFPTYTASLGDALPFHPSNVEEAFQLGAAWSQAEKGNLAEALLAVSALAGRAVTAAQIASLPALVQELASKQSIVDRVRSAFSLVNSVWFVAVCGIGITLLPFVAVLLQKMNLFRIAKEFLYVSTPVGEPLLYALSVYSLVEGSRYVGIDTMAGPYMALTGSMLFLVAWCVTTVTNRTGLNSLSSFMQITGSFVVAFTAPSAILHQSSMLGYVTICAVCVASGFVMYSNGWTTYIGFDREEHLLYAALSCGHLNLLNAIVRSAELSSQYTTPFESAVGVLGTSVFLLVTDIYALLENTRRGYFLQGLAIAAHAVAGTILNLPGMTNVALTYMGLALFTFYCQIGRRTRDDMLIVWLFGLFTALYGSAMYLNRNPHLVVSLLSGGRC